MQEILLTIAVSAGIPSAIVTFCFNRLNARINKKQEEAEKRAEAEKQEAERKEEARRKNEAIVIEGVMASITLGEATAKAVQQIPDAHCNGDMHKALEYATEVKNKHRDFIREQGIEALY